MCILLSLHFGKIHAVEKQIIRDALVTRLSAPIGVNTAAAASSRACHHRFHLPIADSQCTNTVNMNFGLHLLIIVVDSR